MYIHIYIYVYTYIYTYTCYDPPTPTIARTTTAPTAPHNCCLGSEL